MTTGPAGRARRLWRAGTAVADASAVRHLPPARKGWVDAVRMLRRMLALVFGALTLGGAAAWLIVRPWWHRWGVDDADATRTLPGDDLLPEATVSDTRTIAIAAPPSAVWPWLVQMGFGRGGWYSYDQMDMRGSSAVSIDPDLQHLAVGDVVPTHPGGGFTVRELEPGHALVLWMDSATLREQAAAARESGGPVEATPVNLRAGGAMLSGAQPTEFSASWAFVLEPDGPDGTRFIERVRAEFHGGDRPWTAATMPLMGFGVFLMMRRQMLGIRDRVEAAPAGSPAAA